MMTVKDYLDKNPRLEDDIDKLLANMYDDKDALDFIFRQQNPSYIDYLRKVVYTAFDGLSAINKYKPYTLFADISHQGEHYRHEKGKLIDKIITHMRKYLHFLTTVLSVKWDKANVYDSTDIRLTRPNLRLVVQLDEHQMPHCLKDVLEHHFILRAQEDMMCVDVLEVQFIVKETEKLFPINLLEQLSDYLESISECSYPTKSIEGGFLTCSLLTDYKSKHPEKFGECVDSVYLFENEYSADVCVNISCKCDIRIWRRNLKKETIRWLNTFHYWARFNKVYGKVYETEEFKIDYRAYEILLKCVVENYEWNPRVVLGKIKTSNEEYDNLLKQHLQEAKRDAKFVYQESFSEEVKAKNEQVRKFAQATENAKSIIKKGAYDEFLREASAIKVHDDEIEKKCVRVLIGNANRPDHLEIVN